ncbi:MULTISPECIES: restriction endonuclease subunit S [Pseudomonas]|uniref:restriction endonuclease subunit S n=1 Tax=Pseudomonas TaxID=286 RepID=UPI001923F80E|nr:restriction endonuclease subunit S [Pseudomonas paraversuta]
MIPEDWEVKKLGDIAIIATGSTPPTRDSANYGDEFLFVSPADLGDEKDVIDTQRKLTKKGFAISRRFPRDSILFVCIGSIGKCGVASVDLTTNQQINAIFPSPAFSTDYLYYTVCAAAPKVRALAGEQVIPIVNKTQFSETPVSLPSIPEQRAIAAALSDMDALISGLDQFIAKKRDIKQAAMQQLLTGQQRLPGFSGEWTLKRTCELGEIVTGNTPSTTMAHYWGGDFPWITPTDISICRDMFESSRLITIEGLQSIRRLPANTVLVTCIASIGKNAILRVEGACNQQINAVIPSQKNSAEFLYYIFEASKEYLLSNAGTTATSIISKATFSELTFRVPPLEEQAAIATILSDMDSELSTLETRRNKARQLKQGMMQELLTGRIRLSQSSQEAKLW